MATVSYNISEDTNSNRVMVDLLITDIPEGVSIGGAELHLDGMLKGVFDTDGAISFQPSAFGDILAEVKTAPDEETGEQETIYSDTISLHISTGFIEARQSEGGVPYPATNTKDIFDGSCPSGNRDLCWMYYIRVPKGQTLTLTAEIEKIPVTEEPYTDALTAHMRGADYLDRRGDGTVDYSMKVDTDTGKWGSFPLTLDEGVHTVYVVPDNLHGKSRLIVRYAGFTEGFYRGYFQSLKLAGE